MTPEEMYSFLTKNCYFFAEVKCGIVGYCYLISVFLDGYAPQRSFT